METRAPVYGNFTAFADHDPSQIIFRPLIEHHSLTNLIVGAILTGLKDPNGYMKRVQVFNPFSQRICEMPSLPPNGVVDGATMCGDLLCGYTGWNNCARWVGGSFVAATVTLVAQRRWHMCWARPNGVRLLGGYYSPKGRFFRSSKINSSHFSAF